MAVDILCVILWSFYMRNHKGSMTGSLVRYIGQFLLVLVIVYSWLDCKLLTAVFVATTGYSMQQLSGRLCSKKVTAWVESHQAKFRLFFLPAYSPEYNPDEYLNHDLKRTIGTQHQVRTEPELQEQANAFMNGLSKAPEHVQSYFDHPALSVYEEIKQSGNI